jgi:hypothetical protein
MTPEERDLRMVRSPDSGDRAMLSERLRSLLRIAGYGEVG